MTKMKKLSRYEVGILANEIFDKIEAKAKANHEEFMKNNKAKIKLQAKAILADLMSLKKASKEFLEDNRHSNVFDLENIIKNISPSAPFLGYQVRNKIGDAITLAQLECDSLEVLTAKITAKFSNLP